MPVRIHHSRVVRIVEGVRGTVPMRMELALRFDYGRTVPWVTRRRNGTRAEEMRSDRVHAIAGPNQAVLHASVPMRGENLHTVADFTANAGERAWFTLTHALSYRPDPPTIDVNGTLAETEAFWQHWSSRLQYQG
jgi:hypothetical protein